MQLDQKIYQIIYWKFGVLILKLISTGQLILIECFIFYK